MGTTTFQLLPHPDGEQHQPERIQVDSSTSADSLKDTICILLDAKDACWEAADAFVVHQHAHRLDSSGQLVPLLIKGSDGVRAYMRQ